MRWSDCGGPPYNNPPYYLSAYGLAVKHGFKGRRRNTWHP